MHCSPEFRQIEQAGCSLVHVSFFCLHVSQAPRVFLPLACNLRVELVVPTSPLCCRETTAPSPIESSPAATLDFLLPRRPFVGVSTAGVAVTLAGVGVTVEDGAWAGVELADPVWSLSSGCTIRSFSAPYFASISNEASCNWGAWLANILNCSAERVAGSIPFPVKRLIAVSFRRAASRGGTLRREAACAALFWEASTFAASCAGGTSMGASGAAALLFIFCRFLRLPSSPSAGGGRLALGVRVLPATTGTGTGVGGARSSTNWPTVLCNSV